jgi:hypothetical protein
MKTILSLALTFMVTFAFAQESQYTISTTIARTLEEVTVTFWMQKDAGSDLELGNANFRVKVANEDFILPINIASVSKNENAFSRFDRNDEYEASELGLSIEQKLISLNVYRQPTNVSKGKSISETKSRIGAIVIPVNDPNATINLEWVTGNGDVNTCDYNVVEKSSLKYETIPAIEPVQMPNTMAGLQVSRMYPNPVISNTNLIFKADKNQSLVLSVMDMYGRTVVQKPIEVGLGYSEVNLDFSDLKYGSYSAILSNGLEQVNFKFVKQ